MYRAFRKFGIENFSFAVLELCQEEQLIELEQKYYSIYNPTYNNIQPEENPACNEEIKKRLNKNVKSRLQDTAKKQKRRYIETFKKEEKAKVLMLKSMLREK